MTGQLKDLGGRVAHVTTRAVQFGAVMVGVGAAIGIKTNAELETANLQFETLLGNAEDAEEHVASLFKFAKKTPFETQPIITASRHMLTFGGRALATEENLKLVGDAAAATSSEIDQVGFWVGRAYNLLEAGKPFGEAAMRLQEMGILSSEARSKMEDLQKSGADSKEVFAVFEKDLGRFNNAMVKQSETMDGLSSTLKDIIKLDLGEIFEPLFGTTKKAMKALIKFADSEAWDRMKENAKDGVGALAEALNRVIEAFEDGGLEEAFEQVQEEISGIDFAGAFNNSIGKIDLGKLSEFVFRMLQRIDWVRVTTILITGFINSIQAVTRQVVSMLPTVINEVPIAIVKGVVQGIIDAFKEDPLAIIEAIVVIALAPARLIKAVGGALKGIPLVGTFVSWIWRGLVSVPQRLAAPIRNMVASLANRLTTGFRLSLGIKWIQVTNWLKGIAGRIKKAVGSLFGVLWNAGRHAINSLWSGMKRQWNNVAGWLGSVGDKIKNLKGPLDKDKKMLIHEGQAIMDGFNRGLIQGFSNVKRTLQTASVQVGQTPMSGNTQNQTNFHAPIVINDKADSQQIMRQITRNQELELQGVAR